MTITEYLRLRLLNTTEITAIVEQRIYQGRTPTQDGTQARITLGQVSGGINERHLDGPVPLRRRVLHLDAWALSPAVAEELADEITAALHAVQDDAQPAISVRDLNVVPLGSIAETPKSGKQTALHRYVIQVDAWYQAK